MFKKGQRIRCVVPHDNGTITRGKIYIVRRDSVGASILVDIVANDRENADSYYSSRFIPAGGFGEWYKEHQ